MKLILSETPVGKLPIAVILGVIVVTITVSIVWSLVAHPGGPTGEDEARRLPGATGNGAKTAGRP